MKKSSVSFFVALTILTLSFTAMAQVAGGRQQSFEGQNPLLAPLHDPQMDYPGSPEKPLTKALLLQLKALNESSQVYEAWKLLAEQKDGYAQSATRIFGEKITVERCVVESNWKIVVGEEVRDRLFFSYAKLYQRHYIDFLETNRRYPNTLEIESLYQRTDDELGLPQSVSVDLMMNLVPPDWGRKIFFDEFSSLIQIGRPAFPKRWFHYTEISDARSSAGSIPAQDITIDQAKRIYKKAAGQVAKCMAKKLKSTPATEEAYE